MFETSGSAPAGVEERDLAENDAVPIPRRGAAAVVRVERGTVLVTRQGDLDDHVLEPGDELLLPRHGLAVAWAFTPARISWRALRSGSRLDALVARGLRSLRLEPVEVSPDAARRRRSPRAPAAGARRPA